METLGMCVSRRPVTPPRGMLQHKYCSLFRKFAKVNLERLDKWKNNKHTFALEQKYPADVIEHSFLLRLIYEAIHL